MIVALIFFIFSIVNIDERQNGVTTNMFTNKHKVLKSGIHFVWPFINRVGYIFMNQRTAAVTVMLNFSDGQTVEAGMLIDWQVVDPVKYLAYAVTDDFNKELTSRVFQITSSRVRSTNLSTFNQLHNLLSKPVYENDLGIVIIDILPNELNLVVKPTAEVSPILAPIVTTESTTWKADNSLAIESAYYQAQLIKTQTEIEQARMLAPLEEDDPRFYKYFRKLQIYKDSAQSKQDLPELDGLYR